MNGPVLVDTVCWRHHLNRGGPDPVLVALLQESRALTHEWVRLELVMGGLSPRARGQIFRLTCLPAMAPDAELEFIEHERLAQRGLSVVDVQLLHAALATGAQIYTRERAIHAAWRDLTGQPAYHAPS